MDLSGVNRLCKRCSKECKQWKQIKIIRCPFYQRKPDGRSGDVQIPSIEKLEISSWRGDFLPKDEMGVGMTSLIVGQILGAR
jgi:hypothetical protein